MNLLSSLNAGISGAANGTAELYVRGTATRATWYPDFEASTSNSSGSDIALDAYGSAEVYVNQLVDVVVKSSDGTVVRSFTDGYASGNIEVISPAFTGADYVTGMSGVSKPATLQTVLDRWAMNSGAPDWKVDINGTGTTLADALGSLTGLVYNVKSPEFGAVGDGTTNDQAAIQAALSAASIAGGGIVFFPKGTYLITTAIPLDNLVSMVGVGADKSIITVNSAIEGVFQLLSSVSLDSPFIIQGLTFQASQANTGSQLYLAAACKCLVRYCVFGGNALAAGYGIRYNADVDLEVQNCWFNINSATLGAIFGDAGATGSNVRIRDCTALGPASFSGSFLQLTDTFRASVTGCVFDGGTNSTVGTYYGITTTNGSVIEGNNFLGGIFAAAINYQVAASAVYARSNTFVGVTARYAVATVLAEGSFLELDTKDRVSSSGTAFTVTGLVDVWELNSTGADPTITLPAMFYEGQRLTLFIRNAPGSPGNWATLAIATYAGTSNVTIPTSLVQGLTVGLQFVVADVSAGGTYNWRPI